MILWFSSTQTRENYLHLPIKLQLPNKIIIYRNKVYVVVLCGSPKLDLREAYPWVTYWLSSRNFFRGQKSIAMQISVVMLIYLLFSYQISGGEVSEGGKLSQGGAPCPPCGRKPAYRFS